MREKIVTFITDKGINRVLDPKDASSPLPQSLDERTVNFLHELLHEDKLSDYQLETPQIIILNLFSKIGYNDQKFSSREAVYTPGKQPAPLILQDAVKSTKTSNNAGWAKGSFLLFGVLYLKLTNYSNRVH